jgi:phosphate transport system permease protein
VLAETRIVARGVAITAMTFLGGEQSLVVGGSDGGSVRLFRLQTGTSQTGDGFELVQARTHADARRGHRPVRGAARQVLRGRGRCRGQRLGLSTRPRTRCCSSFNRSGDRRHLGPARRDDLPRSNGVMLVSEGGEVEAWQYRAASRGHAARAVRPHLVRGLHEPEWIWQSTAGTDLAEPKYSLVPLIFGTIKAAFYAMLFAAPIALMAAIYTSEFVHRRVRATVKPMMEMMESLPTVVLGFIAALVLAPLVEEWIGAVLLGFIAVPLGLMLGAFAWQMLPQPRRCCATTACRSSS